MSVVVRGLDVTRGARRVLHAVDLRIEPASACALVGPNGAGKSTLLAVLAGLLERDAGHVEVDGIDPAGARRRSVAGHVSLMPQAVSFPFAWSAIEVALMGAATRRSPLGALSAGDIDSAREALRALGVEALAERPVTRLSGGERQRVLLAMQLVQRARVVLLDEPTSAQDFAGVGRALRCVRALCGEGRTVVAALHDLNVAAAGFDRVALVHDGRITAFGEPADVLRGDALHHAYDGAFRLVETEHGPAVLPTRGDDPAR